MPQQANSDQNGIAAGLKNRIQQSAAIKAMRDNEEHPPEKPAYVPPEGDPDNPKTRYGAHPERGEKRIDVSSWMKRLPTQPTQEKTPVYDDGGVVDTDSTGGKKSDDARAANAKKVQQVESVIGAAGQAMSAPHQYHAGAYGPIYDKGGKVNVQKNDVNDGKHQVAILKDGERVLTPEQNKDWEHAKDLGGVVGEHTAAEKSHFHRAMSHLHTGALHRHFNIPEGKPIPMAKKQEAANSDSPHVAAMGRLALAMHGWKGQKGSNK